MAVSPRDGQQLTLSDIAALAGVSRSAASRALDRQSPSGGPGAERVREVARRMGYVPNSWAANLRRQRSGIVGVVVPRLTDTVMAMLYEAIVEECNSRSLHAEVITTGDDPRVALERGRALLAQRIDGMILTTARTDGADPLLTELQDLGMAYSLALRTDGRSSAAVIDDRAGGHAATAHLLERGHTRIAFVGGPSYASSSQQRELGFRDAMAEFGVVVAPELIFESNFSMEAGGHVAQRLLSLATPPTAVFTANDSLAVGLVAVAQRTGIKVPTDLSVVGYNDTSLAAHMAVPLTSVKVPFSDMARNALDLLVSPTQKFELRLTTPTLVARESVATIAAI
ncbi:LacI family DNA-binding transcriptional regulator [Paenarthrobacter nitroguajacolicus]|uniref:LacI family DNA-binding transcriptional regulator n=1 Tax=Paenarthrobacter nitroguajacolicus TaxID=211146 RepID=UPI000B2FEDC5|nr:LacI family DNA-binding transcriptional regulator [Paenarthrobacter nitroguajacolicus]